MGALLLMSGKKPKTIDINVHCSDTQRMCMICHASAHSVDGYEQHELERALSA